MQLHVRSDDGPRQIQSLQLRVFINQAAAEFSTPHRRLREHNRLSEQLRCLFSSNLEEHNGLYVIGVPERELRIGDLQPSETYRVAVLPGPETDDESNTDADPQSEPTPQTPPVEEGKQHTVEIENIGDQGDGIARVERGFVIIVPETEQGERVTITITDVGENVAFAEVAERTGHDVV